MSDEKALLGAIWEHPLEDTPRLIYADWLQETGEAANVARAEFIRLQCEQARLDWLDPRRTQAEAQASPLFIRYRKEWTPNAPGCIWRLRNSTVYDRGFPLPGRELNLHMFRASPASDWDAAPLWKLILLKNKVRDKELLAECLNSSLFSRVSELTLRSKPFAEPPHRWQPEEVVPLIRSPLARNVTRLVLDNNPVGPDVVAALADPSVLPNLTRLSLGASGLTIQALTTLAHAPAATRLTSLDISSCWLDDVGMRTLAAFPPFPNLRELRAKQITTCESGYISLAKWPGLATLYWLDLGSGGNRYFAIRAAQALATSPYLDRLLTLRFPNWPVNPELATVLSQRFKQAYGS
jgi:uncharacterized protein (TIGR02996 family)